MIELSVSLTSNGVVKVPGYEHLVRFGYTKNRGVYRLHVDATGEWEGLTIRAFWHVPDSKDPASSLVADGYVDVPASVTAQPGNGCVTFEGSDGTKTVTSADLRYRVSANSGTEDGTMPEPGTPAWQQLVDAVHTDATAAEQAKTDAQTAASEAAASAGNADQSAQEAADSLQELKDGIASGDFKGEPGTSPTVTVQDIAGGHRIVITDATGTSSVDVMDGKQGDPGKDVTVDATLSQSGKAADAKMTGDELARKAVIDDTAVGTDAWSSKHIVDMLCPPLEETGNPIVLYPVANYPLGCQVSWEPTQEGSGEPSPANVRPIKGRDSVTVERCGENLLDVARIFPDKRTYDAVTFTNNMDGTITVDGITTRTAYFDSLNTFFLPAGNYTICATPNTRMSVLRESDRAVLAASQVGGFKAFTLAKNEICDCFIACDGTFSNEVIRPCIVQGAVDTGWTQFHGDIYDLTLPTTIYGGTVDAVTGDGQETWQLIDSYAGEDLLGKWISDRDVYASGTAPTTGAQVAYKLTEPISFTAPGAQPIPALSGVNTVLTDADSATVTGRADPIKRITDLEDAVASMTNT